MAKKIIYTIGHSNRPIDEFIAILEAFKVKHLVDIRSLPGSTKNPQFNAESLSRSLESYGIQYHYIKALGGLRGKKKDSINMGWHNLSFRNYADYMQTESFLEGLNLLQEIASFDTTCMMCAEAVPWRCHRSLVGDALLIRGWEVEDLFSKTNEREHELTSFAKVDGTNITYP